MKKIICSLLMCLLAATAAICTEGNPLLLMSEIPVGPVRSSSPSTNVFVEQNAGELQVSFTANIGLVEICVKNAIGNVIYQTVVNTNVTTIVVIDTTYWSSGDYAIALTMGNGYCLSGEFTL